MQNLATPLARVRAFLNKDVPFCVGVPAGGEVPPGLPPAGSLSTVHIGPFVEYWDGGGVGRVKIPGRGKGPGGKRGEVTSFTLASSMRLQRFMQSVNRNEVKDGELVFMTLTYHLAWPGPREAKEQDLKAFKKRFERAWGPHPAVWKLEPQERGAPHFHLLIWMGAGCDVEALSRWTAENWNQIVRGSADHLRFHLGLLRDSRPCVERLRSWKGVAAYCAERYMGKPIDGSPWAKPGRWWGKWREELWPRSRIMWRVTEAAAFVVKRCMRRFYEHADTGVYRVTGPVALDGSEVLLSEFEGRCSKVIVNPGVQRRHLRPHEVQVLREFGCDVKPIRRRWRRSTGGMGMFIKADDFRRIVLWAWGNVPDRGIDILGGRLVLYDDDVAQRASVVTEPKCEDRARSLFDD